MDQPTFGAHLRVWRKANNLTQEQLAVKISVSQSAITDWESGGSRPAPAALVALADEMGVHPRELTALPTKVEEPAVAIEKAG